MFVRPIANKQEDTGKLYVEGCLAQHRKAGTKVVIVLKHRSMKVYGGAGANIRGLVASHPPPPPQTKRSRSPSVRQVLQYQHNCIILS